MVSSCNNLADKMKASSNLVPFAPSGSWIPKVVPLPQREVDPGKLAIPLWGVQASGYNPEAKELAIAVQ